MRRRDMTMDQHDDSMGWTGDLWEGQRGQDPYGHDNGQAPPSRPPAQGPEGPGGQDPGMACRNGGIAALVLAILAWYRLGAIAAGISFVVSMKSENKGLALRVDGYDSPSVRLGIRLSVIARVIDIIYAIVLLVAVVFMFLAVAGIFAYADK